MLSGEFTTVPTRKITITERKRKKMGDIESMVNSILRTGLIHPIVVNRDLQLVAGERRLQSFLQLCDGAGGDTVDASLYEEIPVQFSDELTWSEHRLLELEENIKRKGMEWTEEASAAAEIHSRFCEVETSWTVERTAEYIGVSRTTIARYLMVAAQMEAGNEKVLAAKDISSAHTVAKRETERAIDDELSQVHTPTEDTPPEALADVDISDLFGDDPSNADNGGSNSGSIRPSGSFAIRPGAADIIQANALDWLPSYEGRKFNLLHCDWPYGINHDKSAQASADTLGSYDDAPSGWISLLNTFAEHHSRVLLPSAHVFFWFPMSRGGEDTYEQLVRYFAELGGKVDRYPYVWFKSDGKGIIPDANRGGRRVYETALLVSFGDRKIVRPVNNCYAAPATKEHHASEKPVPMLKYFLGMLVDELSEVLDFTCGSATALLAAESLGARRVAGVEYKDEHYATAVRRLDDQRKLAGLSTHMESKASDALSDVEIEL